MMTRKAPDDLNYVRSLRAENSGDMNNNNNVSQSKKLNMNNN